MAAIGAALPLIATVVGAGATVIGGIQQAGAAKDEAAATAKAEEENAVIAQQNKVIANAHRVVDVQTAEADAVDSEQATRRNLASIRAAFGGSGTSMAGSPLDALTDTASVAARDTSRIRQEGQQRNREGVLQILGYEHDRVAAKKRAGYAIQAGDRGAAAAVVNTVTRLTRIA